MAAPLSTGGIRAPGGSVRSFGARARHVRDLCMRQAWLILALACSIACKEATTESPTAPTPTGPTVRVLMLTATAGFRHDAIDTARSVLTSLAAPSGFTIAATEDLTRFT